MTASYLFDSGGLNALARYVAPDTLFAFDLDGTLAPIVDDFTAAQIDEPVRATLKRLAELAKVAVITGRSRKDALTILGMEPHLVVGNHGAEWPAGPESRNKLFVQCCTEWREQLLKELHGIKGVEIEFKGESLSLHYRKAIHQENTCSRIDAAIDKLTPSPKKIGGKYVVNLLPLEAFTKGEALMAAMASFGLERAVYFGDDVTDEEVFQLKGVDLFGIHIGKDGQTAAPYYLTKPSALLGLLNSMVGMLEMRLKEEQQRILDAAGCPPV
jgi:trehalose 6-phosphate phosphatase